MQIDHGKCVSGDSLVYLVDKGWIRADRLYEELSKKSIPVRKSKNKAVYEVKKLGIRTDSFDKINQTLIIKPITHIWKLKAPERLIEIKLRDGTKVKVTPEHKFLVLNSDGNLEERPAKFIGRGEYVVCPRKVDIKALTEDELKEFILTKLSENSRFLAYVTNDLNASIKSKCYEVGQIKKVWRKLKLKIKYNSLIYCFKRKRFRVCDLVSLANYFSIPLATIYDSIKFIACRSHEFGGRTGKMRLPTSIKDWENLMWFAGLMFGDGDSNGYLHNSSSYILNKAKKVCTDLGLHSTVFKPKNRTTRLVTGRVILYFLQSVFEFPKSNKSRTMKLPKLIEIVEERLFKNFIIGYFDADGTVEFGRSAVSVSSASRDFLKRLQHVLLRIGIRSILQDDTLYISGKENLTSFPGFSLTSKAVKFRKLYEKSKISRVVDTIPVSLNDSQFKLPIIQKNLLLDGGDFHSKICFIEVLEKNIVSGEKYVYDFTVPDTHNLIINSMIIHNTTFSDHLLAGSGIISKELAGRKLFLDFDIQEQQRGITIWSANASMIHEYEGKHYLVNLIDTPGHVDFGGDVTRAMRAVDGAIVLVCAVEGVMPQTETVLRQSLKERVKPILFINKVDRLIKELKLTPEQMQKRFTEIITEVNRLIQKYAEDEYKNKWLVNVNDGSVAFGSALRKWAISVPFMKKTGITFKDIIDLTVANKQDELAKKAPLYNVVLDMIIKHLPSPVEAQKYRVPKIWHGDLDSEIAKQMMSVDDNGHLAGIITKLVPDPHAGFVSCARIFSGKIRKGDEVYLVGQHKAQKVQQVSVYKGPQRIQVDEVVAGNIVGITGLSDAFSGETICEPNNLIEPFERIKHLFEPVVTKSIEPKDPKDLMKLINFLKKLGREDPTIKVKINEETGEYLVSGLGELHLDAKVERKLKEQGIEFEASPPIVVYRETISKKSSIIEGKSPNKHNKLYFLVKPLENEVLTAMKNGEIPSDLELKKKNILLQEKLVKYGMNVDEIKKLKLIHGKNMLLDQTKGVQYLNEIMEMVKEGFVNLMDEGPLSREPCVGLKVSLVDAELHEDPVHRGPGQIIPAVRYAIRTAILNSEPILLEPKQIIRVDVPSELMGGAIKEIQNRRGKILDMREEMGTTIIKAKIPVSEMFGFNSSLKSATGGKGFYSLIDVIFERLPKGLQDQTVLKIRKRKGLSEVIPRAE